MTNLTPSQRASQWLDAFGAALAASDPDAAAALFDDDCYWRDLVSFTWNICTQEGKPAIRTMLQNRLADVAPSDFALEGEASEAGGVIDAWFSFATSVARPRPSALENVGGGRPGLDPADQHGGAQGF